MNIIKKHGLKIIGVTLLFLLIFFNLPWGKAFYKTLILLPEFVPNSPVKPLNFLAKKPQILEVSFPGKEETVYADLWLPAGNKKHPAVVLHLGVDIDRKDQRAQKLADSLARSGIATLIPNIPPLSNRRVLAQSKDDLISSFKYLKSHPQIKKDKVGFVSFCAAGGLVLLASEEKEIADSVAFIVTINPYYELSSLYENLTLRQIADGNKIFPWRPNFKTVEIYNRETISLLEDKEEKEILLKHLVFTERKNLEEGSFPPLEKEEEKSLSKEAKFTYELLTNKNPEKKKFYLDNATEKQKKLLVRLSPSTEIENLKAKTFILMDKQNVFIPYTQAKILDQALKGKAHLSQTKLLAGGDLASSLSFKDYPVEAVRIFRFVFNVFKEIS